MSGVRSMLLVRHAETRRVPDLPSKDWGLSRDGLIAAMNLGDALPYLGRRMLTSSQPKAMQTARAIIAVAETQGAELELVVDGDLDEVGRPSDWDGDELRVASRYLDGEHIDGWEPQSSAVRRVDDCLRRAQDEGARILVTHGMLLALWLAPRVSSEPSTIWRGLTTPDIWRFDTYTNQVRRLHY